MNTRLPKARTIEKKRGETVKHGDVLKALRAATGLTQEEFAPLMNTTKPRLANWEINKYAMSAPTLLLATIIGDKIARAEFFKRVDDAIKAAKKD